MNKKELESLAAKHALGYENPIKTRKKELAAKMNVDLGTSSKLVKDKDVSSEFERHLFTLHASLVAVTSFSDKTNNAKESIIFIGAKNYIYPLCEHIFNFQVIGAHTP